MSKQSKKKGSAIIEVEKKEQTVLVLVLAL